MEQCEGLYIGTHAHLANKGAGSDGSD
jgi:hypothetical protein